MSITIHPELEMTLRMRAEAQGLTVEAYLKRLVRADQQAEDELEALAVEGLESGKPIEVGPDYWEEKHRRLDERLKKTGTFKRNQKLRYRFPASCFSIDARTDGRYRRALA